MLKKSASKKALDKNIATEVKSGKPVKVAVAIAYDVKKKAEKGGEHGKGMGKMMKKHGC